MAETYAFLKTGAIDLIVARLPGGAGILPPRNYVPTEDLVEEPVQIISYPQTEENNPDSRWSTWVYELEDGEWYTMTIRRAIPLWSLDGIRLISDQRPWGPGFTSGVTVPPAQLYTTVKERLQSIGATVTGVDLGFSYVAVPIAPLEEVITHRFVVLGAPGNFWAKAGAYEGDWGDPQPPSLLPGETTTTTTTTTVPPLFLTTTTTTRQPVPPTPRVASVPLMFATQTLDEADIDFGFNVFGGAKSLPVPLPDEYQEEFSDFDNMQIKDYNFWTYGKITVKNYRGEIRTQIDADGNIYSVGSLNIDKSAVIGESLDVEDTVTATDVWATTLTGQFLSDGVTQVRIEDLLELMARVADLETP